MTHMQATFVSDFSHFQQSSLQSTSYNKVQKLNVNVRVSKIVFTCAVFAPKKPHTSLSILENFTALLPPSPRKTLETVTTLLSVRNLSLFSLCLFN